MMPIVAETEQIANRRKFPLKSRARISDGRERAAAGQEGGTDRMAISSTPARSAPGQTVIVLVHGGFVDGSGWEGVYQALKKDGYDVSVVQNPTDSLAGDV